MTMIRRLPLFALLVFALLFAACGPSNTIHLKPLKHTGDNILPTPSSVSLTVVKFADKREDKSSLGLRRDQSYFTTMDNASEWVTRAIADRFASAGYQASYAGSPSEARKGSADYVLTGSIEELVVRESSATSYEVSMRVRFVLADRNDKVVKIETLSSSSSRTTIPTSSSVENLLGETLKGIVDPMFDKIDSVLRK